MCVCIYTAVQKFEISKIFLIFLKEMLIKAVSIWSKIQKKRSFYEILLHFKISFLF